MVANAGRAACRGRGFATRLLRHALADMAASGVEWSMLHAAPAAAALYAGLGWRRTSSRLVALRLPVPDAAAAHDCGGAPRVVN